MDIPFERTARSIWQRVEQLPPEERDGDSSGAALGDVLKRIASAGPMRRRSKFLMDLQRFSGIPQP
jgi:hypothetical protein